MKPVLMHHGDSPIIPSLPQTGTYVRENILGDLSMRGRGLDDPDWHFHTFHGSALPDSSTDTNRGATCDRAATTAAEAYRSVSIERFRGGWTTHQYGQPGTGIHATQMELPQSDYTAEAPPWAQGDAKAARLRRHLTALLTKSADPALTSTPAPGGKS